MFRLSDNEITVECGSSLCEGRAVEAKIICNVVEWLEKYRGGVSYHNGAFRVHFPHLCPTVEEWEALCQEALGRDASVQR